MSTLHLETLLDPSSIALIGASDREASAGHVLARKLWSSGYHGTLFFINPRYREVLGAPCYRSLQQVPETPDLVVFVAPSRIMRRTLLQCHRRGVNLVIVLSAVEQSDALLALANRLSIRLIGPYSAGLIRPHLNLNASFASSAINAGSLAVVSQSTSLGAAIIDWAETSGVGFSAVLSSGDELDVSLSDLLDLLAEDHRTRAIIVQVDRISNPRSFLSALSAVARIKPVVVLRSTHEDCCYCDALLRTGEWLSSGVAFDAALARTGALRIRSFSNLLAAARMLSLKLRVSGHRLAIVSNGAAAATLGRERIESKGYRLPRLSDRLRNQLADGVAGEFTGHNPIVLRDAEALIERYRRTIDTIQAAGEIDAVLVIHVPDTRTDAIELAQAVVESSNVRKPLLACWMGDHRVAEARRALSEAGLPAFRTPEAAIDGFDYLFRHHANQQLLLQLPEPASYLTRSDPAAARQLIERQLARQQRVLPRLQAEKLLRHFDIDRWPRTGLGNGGSQPRSDQRILKLSLYRDAALGPVLSLAIEGDQATQLPAVVQIPPLNQYLVDELLSRAPLAIYLGALGDRPAVGTQGLEHLLRQLSEMACELPTLYALHIDKLVIANNSAYIEALEVVIQAARQVRGYTHLAIHPYPRNWIRQQTLRNGQRVTIRPIRPEDGESIQNLVRSMSAESRYYRFMHTINELSPQMVAQFTKLDYDRQMAFVIEADNDDIAAVSRYVTSGDRQWAEFGLSVGENWKRLGLGSLLMKMLMEHARAHGVSRLVGSVLRNNNGMRRMMTSLGFEQSRAEDDPDILYYHVDLLQQSCTAEECDTRSA